MKNICASCKSFNINKIVKVNNEKIPDWLKNNNYVNDFIINTNLKDYRQKNTNMKLKLNVGKNKIGKKCLYWEADPTSKILINDAKNALQKQKSFLK